MDTKIKESLKKRCLNEYIKLEKDGGEIYKASMYCINTEKTIQKLEIAFSEAGFDFEKAGKLMEKIEKLKLLLKERKDIQWEKILKSGMCQSVLEKAGISPDKILLEYERNKS